MKRAKESGADVEFSYCGDKADSISRFDALCKDIDVKFTRYPRVENFADMGAFFKKEKFHFGIVILSDMQSGTVSPSKFSGYVSFGLPIIYFGPEGTNACDVCAEYGAGIAMSNASEVDSAVESSVWTKQPEFAAHTADAIARFTSKTADELADAICKPIGML